MTKLALGFGQLPLIKGLHTVPLSSRSRALLYVILYKVIMSNLCWVFENNALNILGYFFGFDEQVHN